MARDEDDKQIKLIDLLRQLVTLLIIMLGR